MANKDGSTITIDKPSMAFAVAAVQLSSRKVDAERSEMLALLKELNTDPELLSGDRAELYKETLDSVAGFAGKVNDVCLSLRKVATDRNEKFNLGIDFKKMDAKAQENLDQAKNLRARKLKGQ